MALLPVKTRQAYFKKLGLGEYNEENIRKLQKKYMRPADADGIYGTNTDRLLRHIYNCSLVKDFKPEEFRCPCGHCTGYPTYMKQVELNHIQTIRDHYGKPMTITSGLRCDHENRRVGGVPNSGHKTGYAVDFYMQGVTDTVPNRNKALSYIKELPDHKFTYGAHMVDSDGAYREASGMGNAMHTETKKPAAKTLQDKICDAAKRIADSGKYKYIKYNKEYAKKCGFCKEIPGHGSGGNCICFAFHCWHEVLGSKCSFQTMTDQLYEKLLKVSNKEAVNIVHTRTGLKDIKVITDKSGISTSKLNKGDIIAYFDGNNYIHTAIYVGSGKIADCTSGRKQSVKYGIKSYAKWKVKVAIRYSK